MKPMRVAIVGAGNIGWWHALAFAAQPAQWQVVALCDSDPARAQAMSARLQADARVAAPEVLAFDSLMARADVDLVDICTPPFLHVAQCEAALDSGKHVLCEKPLAASLSEIDRLAAAQRRNARQLLPIFQNRFSRDVARFLAVRKAGLLGAHHVTTMETAWYRAGDYYALAPWRGRWETELGGTLAIHSIHAHDLLTHLLGTEIVSVHARTATRSRPVQTDDLAVASFAFADGSFATSITTLASAREISRYRFVFENVTIEADIDPNAWEPVPWRFIAVAEADAPRLLATLDAVPAQPDQFDGQFAAMHRAFADGSPQPLTLADARRSIELLSAMYASAHGGQAEALPMAPSHPFYAGWKPSHTG